jgi:Phosphotransferase system, galactitol-specific IIB component
MRIITLCGCGLGTCFILKFTVEKVLKHYGVVAEVTPCDLSSAALEHADIYVYPQGLQIDTDIPHGSHCIQIRNVIDEQEIEEKLKQYIKNC